MLVHVFTAGLVIVLHVYNMPGHLDDPGIQAQVEQHRELVELAVEVLKCACPLLSPTSRG